MVAGDQCYKVRQSSHKQGALRCRALPRTNRELGWEAILLGSLKSPESSNVGVEPLFRILGGFA
jgi:hypothetical protein